MAKQYSTIVDFGPIKLSTNRSGDVGETFAVYYLMTHGLEVFKNSACTGPADLFVWNPDNNKALAVDIKSMRVVYLKADGNPVVGHKPIFNPDGVSKLVHIHGSNTLSIPDGFWEYFDITFEDI